MECWCFNKNFRKPFLNKVNHVGCFEQLPKLPQYTDRQIKENSKSLKKEVDAINNDESNAKSLFYLKSGRDRFSSFKEKDFEFLLDFKTLKNKHINQFNNKDKLKTLRWICRGLSVNNAIRKVQIDLDINENWKQSRKHKYKLNKKEAKWLLFQFLTIPHLLQAEFLFISLHIETLAEEPSPDIP